MDNSKLNNPINKKLNDDYPKNFSICDVDGFIRFNFWDKDKTKRILFFECKHQNEPASQTQLESLFILKDNFKWENFTPDSGVFLIRHNLEEDNISEEVKNTLNIYNIELKDDKYIEVHHSTLTFDQFHKMIINKGKLDKYGLDTKDVEWESW